MTEGLPGSGGCVLGVVVPIGVHSSPSIQLLQSFPWEAVLKHQCRPHSGYKLPQGLNPSLPALFTVVFIVQMWRVLFLLPCFSLLGIKSRSTLLLSEICITLPGKKPPLGPGTRASELSVFTPGFWKSSVPLWRHRGDFPQMLSLQVAEPLHF